MTPEPQPERSAMHVEALNLLRHRRVTLTVGDVADASGVTVSWLRALLQDQIDEPSALKLEKLIAFFAADAERMQNV
jgi:transcriptional regulator with XRE-family HTH domain